ncbi:Monooxygenase FAD-binding protein [Pseudomonas sp. JV551A1]|uniref:Monooxygenase FAD-binding protein n=1 Tax=Pseudomonas inefficax TaxID=2078786 RepID=A0AAQ1PAK3_9PSED|nr:MULTISPECIES: FAD-dependent oxidoreductase [Pseudomonas]SPO54614.1 Monooxygenase FAD-binding protein [Pseudomonas sp. JV551A1]SPO62105.1 Monooxygenase FAD-binding protein [Pseudomonas inefficax]
MSDVKRVLIVGCGIGGATAAYTLARIGLSVHCVDIAPKSSAAGTGICLLHNTLRALRAVELDGHCLESGLLFERFRQFDAAGNQTAVNPTPPGIGIRRPDLAHTLESAAIAAGATIEFGVTVTELEERANHVEVTFSNGSRGEYDIVVAADGTYSKTRRKVFGPDFEPEFVGQSGWRFSAPRQPDHDGFFLFRNNKGVAVGAIPTAQDTCYLFFLEGSQQHLHMPDDQLDTLLRERLAEYSAPLVRAALDQVTGPERVLFRPFDVRLMPGPWWHRGRVVLLGDAAHAPTPQLTSGGGLAIEDAVVLAECLSAPGTAMDALEAYSRRRIPRVKRVWEASRQLSQWERDDPLGNAEKSAALLLDTYRFLGEPM